MSWFQNHERVCAALGRFCGGRSGRTQPRRSHGALAAELVGDARAAHRGPLSTSVSTAGPSRGARHPAPHPGIPALHHRVRLVAHRPAGAHIFLLPTRRVQPLGGEDDGAPRRTAGRRRSLSSASRGVGRLRGRNHRAVRRRRARLPRGAASHPRRPRRHDGARMSDSTPGRHPPRVGLGAGKGTGRGGMGGGTITPSLRSPLHTPRSTPGPAVSTYGFVREERASPRSTWRVSLFTSLLVPF